MTAQGMGVEGNGRQRLAGSPDGIYHFRVERAHDEGDLHLVVGGWVKHPGSLGATTTGGWSATYGLIDLFSLVTGLLPSRAASYRSEILGVFVSHTRR